MLQDWCSETAFKGLVPAISEAMLFYLNLALFTPLQPIEHGHTHPTVCVTEPVSAVKVSWVQQLQKNLS